MALHLNINCSCPLHVHTCESVVKVSGGVKGEEEGSWRENLFIPVVSVVSLNPRKHLKYTLTTLALLPLRDSGTELGNLPLKFSQKMGRFPRNCCTNQSGFLSKSRQSWGYVGK